MTNAFPHRLMDTLTLGRAVQTVNAPEKCCEKEYQGCKNEDHMQVIYLIKLRNGRYHLPAIHDWSVTEVRLEGFLNDFER